MSAEPGYPLPVVTADFRDRMGSEFHQGSIKCHPERRLPERRIYAQRFDFAAPSNRKALRVDPSTAHGAGAPRLLRMTFQASECVQTLLSFRKSTVSAGRGKGEGPLCEALFFSAAHQNFDAWRQNQAPGAEDPHPALCAATQSLSRRREVTYARGPTSSRNTKWRR